jgi:hypothetical protein
VWDYILASRGGGRTREIKTQHNKTLGCRVNLRLAVGGVAINHYRPAYLSPLSCCTTLLGTLPSSAHQAQA